MLIFSREKLAFIAVPKTGTTAVEMALRPWADIVFTKRRKHISAQRFHARIAPFLEKEFNLVPDRFAVIREPEEQLRSWYRYRAREGMEGKEIGTGELSFDAFVREVISDDPAPFADIGSQEGMLCSPKGDVLVHHLFAHETPGHLLGFLAERFGEAIELKERNVSPDVPAELDPATRVRLKEVRRAEYELYARVIEAGGHLVSRLP